MKEVNELGQDILDALSTHGGETTWAVMMRVQPDVQDAPRAERRRIASEVGAWLRELETMGRVRRLDTMKPVCWVRVETA